MLVKTDPAETQSYASDASNLAGGSAARVVFPETAEEVAEVLREATRERTPVTVAGAGTGVVGGRVPFGGVVLATDRLNRIREIVRDDACARADDRAGGRATDRATDRTTDRAVGPVTDRACGRATAEAGVVLADLRRACESQGMLYAPDPTEWSCYVGGTIATNASGARTFKYGPTRAYVRRLKIALATGDLIDFPRGEVRAGSDGRIRVPLPGGRVIDAPLPTYEMPRTRKHAAGYFVEPGVDLVDLFVGSEGTLGVVTEAELTLLAKPDGLLAGVVFFARDDQLLAFVAEARAASLRTRADARPRADASPHDNTTTDPVDARAGSVDARALEYFDRNSLDFLREKYPSVPEGAAGAIFFEQETDAATEEGLWAAWLALLERHGALLDASWFATDERGQASLREFRHRLPVLVNEWLARRSQRKVSTDMAVPDARFPEMLAFYRATLDASRLQFVVFGHVGDSHVHVNILPRDEAEAARARDIYGEFVRRAVQLGGTISAEHGVGKIKREYLRALYGERALREMAALKRAFDPACVLGRGNVFGVELLSEVDAVG